MVFILPLFALILQNHLNYQLLRVGTRPEKRAIDRIVMASYDFRFDKIQHLNNVHVMYGQWQWALKKNVESYFLFANVTVDHILSPKNEMSPMGLDPWTSRIVCHCSTNRVKGDLHYNSGGYELVLIIKP